jgi:hypothetical protein
MEYDVLHNGKVKQSAKYLHISTYSNTEQTHLHKLITVAMVVQLSMEYDVAMWNALMTAL